MVNVEIKTATHNIGPSGAIVSSGVAVVDVNMIPVEDVETDPESKKTDDHNNASVNLDTSELEALGNDRDLDQETLNLKLLDKSQSDDEVSNNLFTNKKLRPIEKPKPKNLSSIFSIILFIIGRITNHQRTLNRREKNLVQSLIHACNKNTNYSIKRIKNSLYVHLRTKIYLFSLIYVYTIYV